MNNNKYHIIQFVCIMAAFAAIVLQGFTGVVKLRPLSPYIDAMKVERQDLSIAAYRDGTYQDYLARNAWKKTGFREFFSRCYNQMAFTCFGKTANKNVIKGKNNELYLTGNLKDITGEQLLSHYGSIEKAKVDVQKNVEETLALIDTLHQHGTEFLFVFCPTKTAVYPENMPQPYQENISNFSLVDYYVQLFKENNIPHIDFYTYFKTIKDTFPYPLYTCSGSHWAASTTPFVCDSILRKMEAIAGYNLPAVNYIDPNLSRNYTDQDGELEHHIDLLFPMSKPKVPNPVYALQDTVGKDRPNLLVVGDGYFVQLEHSCFVEAFNQWDFWLYNKTSVSSRPTCNWKHLNQMYDTAETLEDADIVMALFTSNYLFNYLCGFTQTAQELFQKGATDDQEAIEIIKQRIKDNSEWMQAIEKQAKERGLSIEENLHKNAEYILQTEKSNKEQIK